MSISSMTNVAVQHKHPAPANTPRPKGGLAAKSTPQPEAVTQALDLITAYIPTEVITLYVAVISAFQGAAGEGARLNAFRVFVVATPIVVWMVFAAKVRKAGKPVPWSPKSWPKWEMVASAMAFPVWGFALPNSPFSTFSWYNSALAGIVLLIVSTLLGLLTPIVRPGES